MIKTDVDKKPIPQIYNPVNDEYEVLQGANGAARHVIYGADGQPITTAGNKLGVRASEIEDQLTTIQDYIDGLEATLGTPAADPAANTVLARLKTLATLVGEVQDVPTANTLLSRVKSLEDKLGEVQASPTANTLLARLKALETELAAIKSTAGIKKIVDALPAGENTIGKAKMTDGTNEAKINADGSQLVQVSGSNMEYYVKKFADAPAASSVALGAMLNVIGTDDVWQSNGTDWLVI